MFKSDAASRTPSHQIGDHLKLQDDGTYELDRASRSGPGSIITGHWVFTKGDSPTVDLGHAGFPVRLNGDNVELIVNDDVNARFEKSK